MKRLLVVLISIFFNKFSYGQTSYYDAQQLKKFGVGDEIIANTSTLLLPENDSVFRILKYYVPASDSNDTHKIVNDFANNPFMHYDNSALGSQGSTPLSGKGSFFSSIGGLDVTKFANAIADIMIERAKQELTIAFFNRFKAFAKDNPEFQILFPKTTDNLSNLLSYTYPQMLPALRNGFFEDLKQIAYHLDDVLDLPRYQKLLANFPEVKIAIRSLRLVHELETGASNAADIITEFASYKEWSDDVSSINIKSVGGCLKIAALFSESIRNDTSQSHTTDIWVPAKELKKLFYDSTLFNIYMGLLYQESIINEIKYFDSAGTKHDFSEIIKKQQNNLFLFQNKLKEFFDLAGNVNVAFKDLKNKIEKSESPSNDNIYNYINVSLDAVEYSFSIVKIFKEIPSTDEYLAIARRSNNLYRSIYTKQYTQAVNDAFDIFTILSKLIKKDINIDSLRDLESVKSFAKSADNSIKKLIEGGGLLSSVRDKEILKATNVSIKDSNVEKIVEHYNLIHILDFVEKVKPYALFMANMVEAKDEAAVKAALENVILPVGSSSIKKNTQCNISIQSYLGAYLSVSNGSTSSGNAWSDKFGVTAPIGISWTPSFFSWQKGGSLSLFGSLFDLGAIVDYKLKKDSTTGPVSKDYKIELGQIFSPGVYAVYGFAWNLPLSFGFGAQYGPGLSKIDGSGNPVIGNPSVRWNLFLGVDMPFFTLKNRNKNFKPSK